MSDIRAQHFDEIAGGKLSLSGQKWRLRRVIPRLAEQLAGSLGLPTLLGELLISRGVDMDTAGNFLAPRIAHSLPDPLVLKDMDQAVARIMLAVKDGQKICVYGDYDVDGATSGALLLRYLRHVGARVMSYVPDRMAEGYGPNVPAFHSIQQADADLVITVDCGTLSFDALNAAQQIGLDVVVIDHHKAEPELPPCAALVNPNRLDDTSEGLEHLAAVGVVFLLVIALNRALREAGGLEVDLSPNLPMQWLDLVALGTVCDVVSLTGLNRAFVAQGLKVVGERHNPGIRALMDVARVDEAPGAYHLGFLMGPRVNAGGRVGNSALGTQLLLTDDATEAGRIAAQLDGFNSERQAIEADVLAEAIAAADYSAASDPRAEIISCVAGEGWHAGVIGIIASRLKERYGLPSLVISIEEGEAKGSARSISGVDIGAAVIEARAQGLLIKGGGHAMAAGFSLLPEQIEPFKDFLANHLRRTVLAAQASRALTLDATMTVAGATPHIVEKMDALAPFGMGNAAPKIMLADAVLIEAKPVGKDHIRLLVKDSAGTSMKVMAFRQLETPLGQALLSGIGQRFHMAGKLKVDRWTGRPRVEMTLEDAMTI